MVNQKAINVGLLFIAGGSAIALYAFRDRLFNFDSGISLKLSEFNFLQGDIVGEVDGVPIREVALGGFIHVTNKTNVTLFPEVHVIVLETGQFSPNPIQLTNQKITELNSGVSADFETIVPFFVNISPSAPSKIDVIVELTDQDGVIVERKTRTFNVTLPVA